MIRNVIFSTVALAALTVAAQAADLPRRQMAPAAVVMAPAFTWSGLYVGVHAGYGFSGDGDVSTTGQAAVNVNNVVGGARPGLVSLDRDGFIGGGQIGYNYQFGQIVAGLEADISYTDFGDTKTFGTRALVGGAALSNTYSSDLNYLGTVRGRLGYAFDRVLVYGTGGLAYGETEHSASFSGAVPPGVTQFYGSRSRVKAGYTIGGGVEYAVTNNFTVKGEYLYYNLGKDTVNVAVIPGSGGGGTGYNSRFENDGHIVRIGLNYKFSSGLF